LAEDVLKLDANPLGRHPERLPLRGIDDGIAPRYHDDESDRVTLHARESLRSLENVLGQPVSELAFDVVKPKTRCLATHANPGTGDRDLPILTTLTRSFHQENPTFAVAMVPSRGGGEIRIGDEVTAID
jgi:hypothetical protein